MSDSSDVRYTVREAIDNLRGELLAELRDVRDDIKDVKSDVKMLSADVRDLKSFRGSVRDAVKVIAFIITTAIAVSAVLVYSGVFK